MSGSSAGSLIGKETVPQGLKPIASREFLVGAKAPPPGAKHIFLSAFDVWGIQMTGPSAGVWAGTGYSVELVAC
jgi:hypothetical protein